MTYKRNIYSKWMEKKKERFEKYIEKRYKKYFKKQEENLERILIKNELKNIPKIFDHKEKEVVAIEKGIFIEEGEVIYSPKYVSPIIRKAIS